MNRDIETWEGEGGAPGVGEAVMVPLRGTEAQVEWAGRIRRRVSAEFDRVTAAFRSVARRQRAGQRADTEAIIAIVEQKRAEAMRVDQAGYFIHDWQEIGDQVRQMLFRDPRYQAIKANRVRPGHRKEISHGKTDRL